MIKKTVLIFIIITSFLGIQGQTDTLRLSMNDAISLAQDSSLAAFRTRYSFEVGYWAYKSYLSRRLPSLNLEMSPFTYNHSINKQFNNGSYNYYKGQSLENTAALNLAQNITKTGGSIYAKSKMERLENYIGSKGVSYSSTPLQIGINQPIFGFNTFKWEKRIEPLKFQKAKLDFVQATENIAISTVDLYFNLVFAQQNFKIAQSNYSNADTLYKIGQKRFQLMAINKADLLTLQLELINSNNRLKEAQNNHDKALSALCIYLGLPQNKSIATILPDNISIDSVDKNNVIELARSNNPFYVGLDQQTLESARDVERARIESRFSSNLDLSLGLNQDGQKVLETYKDPSQLQVVSLGVKIPIVDWGQKRGRYNLAKSQQKLQESTLKQNEIDFEQNIQITINEFNLQVDMLKSAKEAADVAVEVYEMNKQRFVLGQMDVNTLVMQLNRKENAIVSYINALEKYWKLYYNLRYITLFDFNKNSSLVGNLDEILGL